MDSMLGAISKGKLPGLGPELCCGSQSRAAVPSRICNGISAPASKEFFGFRTYLISRPRRNPGARRGSSAIPHRQLHYLDDPDHSHAKFLGSIAADCGPVL